MKRFKSVLALILCAALSLSLFAACTDDGGDDSDDLGNVVYGRYVETEISPEGMAGNPQTFASFEGGVLDLVSVEWGTEENNYQATYHRWRSTDAGESWQPVSMEWTKEYINDYTDYYDRGETPPEEINLGQVTPMANGDALATIYRYTNNAETGEYTSSNDLIRVDASGNVSPFPIPDYDAALAENPQVYMQNMQVLPGNRLYFSYYIQPTEEQQNDPGYDWNSANRSAVYDLTTGNKVYDLTFNGWQLFYNDNTLFYNDYEKGYQALNLADGTPYTGPMPKTELLQQLGQNYNSTVYVDNNYNFYTVTARGMDKYAPEAEAVERVMDGLNYTYGSPLYNINSMTYDAGADTLIMAVQESYDYANSVTKMLKYTWDDEAIASSDRKITVYSLYDNYSVRLALSAYKRQFPDVTIEYETAFAPSNDVWAPRSNTDADGNAMTEEDALRALNTELLNGTGPDVLILDGLPVESFIDKGVLEDLTELVQGNDDLFESLFTPLAKDGKYYALPTNFYIPSMLGEKSYIQNITSFDSLLAAIQEGAGIPTPGEFDESWTQEEQEAYWRSQYGPKPAEEQPTLYFSSALDIFETFYPSCAPAILSEKGGIDQQSLAAFLEAVKSVYDKYDIGNTGYEQNYGDNNNGGMSMGGYAVYEYTQTLNYYQQRQSRLGYTKLGSYNILLNTASSLYWSGMANQGKGVVVTEDGAITGDVDGTDNAPDTGTDEPMDLPDDASLPDDSTADDGSGLSASASSGATGKALSGAIAVPASDPSGGDSDAENLPAVDTAVIVEPGLAEGVYMPTQMVGVTTTSKRPQLAKDFVKVFLSEEVQRYDMGNGFPVARSAMKMQYDKYEQDIKNYYNNEDDTMKAIPFDYEAVIGTLKTPYYANEYLKSHIYDPVFAYCTGASSLENAVQQIVSETQLYFAERQ